MYELDKTLALRWNPFNNQKKYAPSHLNIPCPNVECTSAFGNLPLKWNDGGSFAWSRADCAVCGQMARFFIIDPPVSPQAEDVARCRILVMPPQAVRFRFEREIETISPSFVKIYKQTAEAEMSRLDELIGIGYRKALEFLVKDYLCVTMPENADAIRTAFLGDCLNRYVTDEDIRDCAARAVWLGNDETHYVRRWEHHDLQDLKTLLELTLHWVSKKLLTQRYRGEMPAVRAVRPDTT